MKPWRPKKKGRQEGLPLADFFAVLFCPPIKSAVKKDTKKSSRPFWTAKGRLGNKVGKSRGTCVHLKYTLETESFKCEKLEKKAHNCYARSVCKLYARGLITDT